MMSVKPLLKSLFIPTVLFLGACCSQQPVVVAPPPPPVVQPGLGDVFFDFDKSELRMDAVEQLKINANWLQANASRKVIIEGHCDERGTNEYNIALGERRANRAKEYIVNLGVNPSSMKTVSFGEERPFAVGHNEEAWAQNRRAHFVVE
ncbi:MAG: peptidoglycan-associated lipoprotein Pal [Chlorobiales bacterium]|nr:peptidoglycan-associated lipoprotein Pal [Chlorobiales bacterium]